MTRAQIAYRVADIVDWELQKKRRARAAVGFFPWLDDDEVDKPGGVG